MPFWTYQNLAKLTQGTWLVPPPPEAGNALIPAAQRDAGPILWHDTREIQPGQVYLAIAGENFDGNRFVPQAFAAGAALAIVDSESAVSGQLSVFSQNQQPVLRVDDSVKALQQLARAYRQELSSSNTSGGGGCKVIGIAGSNGKTTTRHLIHHVLTHAGKTGTQSPKSFNNHLGVPLTLLAARPTDDFVACEIGTNHPGEIDFLSEIAKPDIAVITSIGEEHLEFFKDLDGVAKEESSIVNHLQPDGAMFLGHGVAALLAEHLSWEKTEHAFLLDIYEDAYLPEYSSRQGPHFWTNASIAGSIAEWMSVDHDTIKAALVEVRPISGRMQAFNFGEDITLYHDAYNANPSSMSDMVEWFASGSRAGRRVLVIGDMLELGEAAVSAHQAIGEQISMFHNYDLITVGVGKLCARHLQEGAIYSPFPQMLIYDMDEKSAGRVAALLQPGDTVLLKASRGMRLERLIPAIEKRFGNAK